MDKKTTATIRDRGQVTIPADVRRQAQLDEGAVVEFEVCDDGVLLRPRLAIADLDVDDEFIREVISSTTDGYDELRADPDAWAQERSERELLEQTLADGLESD